MLEEIVTEQEQVTPGRSSSTSQALAPKQPLLVIEPTRGWKPINLRDIWIYRELLVFLTWRDLKIRYKQTILGAVWVIVQPLLMTLIFTIFLGKLARVPSKDIPYAILVYSGLMPWTFFSNAITYSGNSLVANTNLVTKIYFPRAIIPAAAVGGRLVDFGVAFLVMIGLMFYYGIVPGWNLLMFPVFVLLITMLSLGLGLWSSALNVRYRDVGIMLPVLVQLWMFVSPVVYPIDLVPARWQWLYSLNPMAGIIEGVRSSLLNRPFNWVAIGSASVITVCVLLYSLFAFKRMEKHFADVV